jgi:hypothetical protein
MNEKEKQLMALRALTATTGVIHEAQVFQLRYWGGIAFTGEWTVAVDVEKRMVTYNLLGKKRKHDPKVIAALDMSVHWLFGDDWCLNVVEKGKVIYSGPRLNTKDDTNERRLARASNAEGSSPAK